MGQGALPHICNDEEKEREKGKVKKTWTYGHVYSLLLAVVLAAVVLTACGSEETLAEEPVDILSRFNAEGKAWVCVDINLPFDNGDTRATTFDDGTSEEWDVKKVTIVLFKGSSEANATCASTSDMTFTGPTTSSEPQITSTVQVTSQNIEGGDNVFMLVVLNGTPTITVGQKLADLTITGIGDATYGFVMSNTPVSSKGGSTDPSGATVSTLVQVSPSFFQASESAAESNPVQVFVERAAAKVTVKDGTSSKAILGNTTINFETSDLKWALDNYNTSCYLTRQFSTSWLGHNASSKGYRMVEQSPLLTAGSLYRTYWGQDINYTSNASLTYASDASSVTWKAMNANDYCAENTMDVAQMTDRNTTSVLVRLKLNNGKVFYTTSVTGSDVIFQEPGEGLEEEGTSASSSFVRTRSNFVTPDATNYPNGITISSYLRQWLMQYDKVREWVDNYAGGDARFIEFTLVSGDVDKAGPVMFEASQTAQTISGSAGQTAWEALDVATLLQGITVTQYPEGYCYYRVLIQHFGDDLMPWTSTSAMNKTDTKTVYGDGTAVNENAYLGRYGVVRNNWYNINITSVSHVGSPVIPPLTDYADDVVEQLINAKVVVSKWTVHEQEISY